MNIITDAKRTILNLHAAPPAEGLNLGQNGLSSSLDCSGDLIHRSPPPLIKCRGHVATPQVRSKCPRKRDVPVIHSFLFSSVPDHILVVTLISPSQHGTVSQLAGQGEEAFSHPPGPKETPVDAVGQKTASSPMWSDIVGRGSIDSNEIN